MNSRRPQLTYYNMSPSVVAFSTTRRGGVSGGSYASLNINGYCGDTVEHVSANRRLLAMELGIESDRLIVPHQTHGVEARVIDRGFLSQPCSARKALLEGVDAVLTDVPGLCVGVSTADCIPLLLYDEEHHAVAAVHAGWRGTVARIACRVVDEMRMAYNTDPARLTAVVGPGISLRNFEVGDEVYDAFARAAFDMDTIAERLAMRGGTSPSGADGKKWHINLPLANRQLLIHSGVRKAKVHMSGICTFDHVDDYFSARRLGLESGRIYTGILIR